MSAGPVPVCAAADIPPGNAKSFELNDEHVAVYNVDGEFYATAALCTHGFADLADGLLEGEIVECPLHFGAFDVRTGKALCLPANRDLVSHAVEVVDGDIWIVMTSGGTP